MLNEEIIGEIERKILLLDKGQEFQIGRFLKESGVKGKLSMFNYSMTIIDRLKGKIGISKNYATPIIEVPYLAIFRRR